MSSKFYTEAISDNHKKLVLSVKKFDGKIQSLIKSIIEKKLPNSVILLLHVDDIFGKILTNIVMPGNDAEWETIRKSGLRPYAVGLASRDFIQQILDSLELSINKCLRESFGIPILVADYDSVAIFEYPFN